MLYLSEYSAGLVYSRTNNLIMILHLVSIIVMLLLFLARDKIILKLVMSRCGSGAAVHVNLTIEELLRGCVLTK
jgi:hypothetical protein